MVDIPKSLGELLRRTAIQNPTKKALYYKLSGQYESLTWAQAQDRVNALASFFLAQGLLPGDRVAILSENRPEWAITDLAIATAGLVSVPLYPSLTPNEIGFLLQNSGAKWIAISNKSFFLKLKEARPKLTELKGVLAYEASVQIEKDGFDIPVHLMSDAERQAVHPELEERFKNVSHGDIASIIYTSGTTGTPKGVMLTHGNFIYNTIYCHETLKMSSSDSHLSFLPLSHVFERTAGHYLMIYLGASIAYAENLDTVPKNILEIKPTFLFGVPRFFEKIQTKVTDAVKKASPIRQGVFYWAKELGRKKRQSEKISLINQLLLPLAKALVYKKFKDGLGGRIRFCVSGGAPLPKEIAEFFCDLGIVIYEGYGLTETSPVMSVNREGRVRFGSVGLPLRDTEIKLTAEGEIITKSLCVMKGYYGLPDETSEVLKDGWFYTGDLGRIDKDGFVYITGRKKELIVTSGGKKVSPAPIEELLQSDPYILRCVLFGEGKKFLTALIVPQISELVAYAQQQKIAFSDEASLLKDRKIIEFLDARIQALMKDYASYEKIKYFHLLEHDFSLASGELTPSLKVKRSVVLSRHTDALLKLYEERHA
jgi:long-chain acyl-CoA synthetase